jgi:TonB family protein
MLLTVSLIVLLGLAISLPRVVPDITRQPPASANPGSVPRAKIAGTLGPEVQPPAKVRNVEPVYPAEARQAGVRGAVVVRITIGTDGTVNDAQVVRSVPPLEAALDAVREWMFEPTVVAGKPVEVVMDVLVNFTLPV